MESWIFNELLKFWIFNEISEFEFLTNYQNSNFLKKKFKIWITNFFSPWSAFFALESLIFPHFSKLSHTNGTRTVLNKRSCSPKIPLELHQSEAILVKISYWFWSTKSFFDVAMTEAKIKLKMFEAFSMHSKFLKFSVRLQIQVFAIFVHEKKIWWGNWQKFDFNGKFKIKKKTSRSCFDLNYWILWKFPPKVRQKLRKKIQKNCAPKI